MHVGCVGVGGGVGGGVCVYLTSSSVYEASFPYATFSLMEQASNTGSFISQRFVMCVYGGCDRVGVLCGGDSHLFIRT